MKNIIILLVFILLNLSCGHFKSLLNNDSCSFFYSIEKSFGFTQDYKLQLCNDNTFILEVHAQDSYQYSKGKWETLEDGLLSFKCNQPNVEEIIAGANPQASFTMQVINKNKLKYQVIANNIKKDIVFKRGKE